jgi:osmotically-inducible protein OsmY
VKIASYLSAIVLVLVIAGIPPVFAEEPTSEAKRIQNVQTFNELLSNGKLEEAETLAREALAKDKSDPLATLMLAHATLSQTRLRIQPPISVTATTDETAKPVGGLAREPYSSYPANDDVPAQSQGPSKQKIENQELAVRVAKALRQARLVGYDIQVECRNGEITLLGRIPNLDQKAHAEKATAEVQGVSSVLNQLQIGTAATVKKSASPLEITPLEFANQQLADRVADALRDVRLVGYDFKIEAQGGEITLSGDVPTLDEKARAEKVATQISGVSLVRNQLKIGHVVHAENAVLPAEFTKSDNAPRPARPMAAVPETPVKTPFDGAEVEVQIIRGTPEELRVAGICITPQELSLSHVEFESRRFANLLAYRSSESKSGGSSISGAGATGFLLGSITPGVRLLDPTLKAMFAMEFAREVIESDNISWRDSDRIRLKGKLLTASQSKFLLQKVSRQKDCKIEHSLKVNTPQFRSESIEIPAVFKLEASVTVRDTHPALLTELNMAGPLCGAQKYYFQGSIFNGEAVLIAIPELKSQPASNSPTDTRPAYLLVTPRSSAKK